MKIVVVTLALVFLTGSECSFIWMKDEPKREPGVAEALVTNIKILAEHYVRYLENTEIGKELGIKEDIASMKESINELKKEILKMTKDAWEEVDKELNQKYPIFTTKVLPALKDFKQRWDKHMTALAKELEIMSHKLFSNVKKNLDSFFDTLSSSASRGRDKLRDEVEHLRTTLLPYAEDFRKELEKAKSEVNDDVEEVRKYIYQGVDEIREQIKPYFDKLKSEANPHAEELQKHLLKLLDDIKEATGIKA
ncbi:hypothetical protein XENTR_v10018787 [Xenopus tropicalis]|uniref:Apolipoprotein A-I n=2 Tax=Xenopus tropicalis TaxID=8364 RepID=A0A6I8PU04_XENTR|eukprot:XP_002932957.1 PREDICTED: apolipoprotein A-I [Xenopus tropicalis]